MTKSLALSDADYVIIGRRFGSTAVADEAGEAATRWARDVAALAEYGYGEGALTAFRADVAAHAALREARPTAVAQKSISIDARDDAVTAAWRWVEKVTSLLGSLARKDAALATQLAAATPDEDNELASSVRTPKDLLEANAARLADDSKASDRVAEAEPIAPTLETSAPTVATAKAAPVQDTEELDLADGKLYIAIKDLNAAARKAIRAGALSARASEYRMKHLKRTPTKPAKPVKSKPSCPRISASRRAVPRCELGRWERARRLAHRDRHHDIHYASRRRSLCRMVPFMKVPTVGARTVFRAASDGSSAGLDPDGSCPGLDPAEAASLPRCVLGIARDCAFKSTED